MFSIKLNYNKFVKKKALLLLSQLLFIDIVKLINTLCIFYINIYIILVS